MRDEIPTKIETRGERAVRAKIPKSEARAALIAKLFEEAIELKNATSHDATLGELADVLEVIKSISEVAGIDWLKVEKAADEKRAERGSFKEGVVLLETSKHFMGEDKDGEQQISLRNLSKIETSPDGTLINFYKVLDIIRKGARISLSSGTKLEMSISPNGILIKEAALKPEVDERQLVLPLELDDQG